MKIFGIYTGVIKLEEGVCCDQCVLLAKFCWPLSCFILYAKAKLAYYSKYLLTSYFCIPIPYNEKDIFWGVLILEGLVGLHRTIQLQLLQHYSLGHRLVLLWYWMVCLGNDRDHSVVFETASKCCISESLVAYVSYSISCKGFLPTVVDIMIIWIKFIHSSPF